MATQDVFLDALMIDQPLPMVPRKRPSRPASPPKPPKQPPTHKLSGGYPDTFEEQQRRRPRPSYADDIDRIVADMVARGDVIFDAEAQAYRKPYWRSFKFQAVTP